jgi:hypothetical protein
VKSATIAINDLSELKGQPLSIWHGRLTADYSVLTGGTGSPPLQPVRQEHPAMRPKSNFSKPTGK